MAKDRHEHGHPGHDASSHHPPDYMRNAGGAHEHRDINVRAIFGFLVTLTVFALLVQLALWGMFKYLKGSYNTLDPEPNPMISGQRKAPETDPARDFPKPRLQADAVRDLNKMRQENEAILHGPPTWVDEQAGVVRIPIEQAMKLTLERGLPTDANAAGATPAAQTSKSGLPGAPSVKKK